IKKDVRNGVWNIGYVKDVRDSKSVTIRITLSTLEHVALSGSGEISSTNTFKGINELNMAMAGLGKINLDYEATKSEVSLSGSGAVELKGSSHIFAINMTGSGEVSAAELKSDICEIHISGSGDATVHVNDQLSSFISGSGDVQYSGTPTVNAKISGSGEVSKMN
ncbi:MAG: DUF2807 domain-containing protein, partial [Bacteroidota bacterium]|nr:DUF2807 domain-containing protein [Bacteroidota bacterium]